MKKDFKTLLYTKGITQTVLAEKMKITRSAVNLWANGTSRPTPTYLVKVAEILNITTEELAEYFI